MSESVVVVTGALTSPLGVLPFHKYSTQIAEQNHLSHILSGKEYGNSLPEVWAYMKSLALRPELREPTGLSLALKEHPWAVITHTIDGLHKRAGNHPVVETGGSLFSAHCLRCQTAEELTFEDYESLGEGDVFTCPKCSKPRVRPDVVLLGERVRHRRLVEDFMRESTTALFVGVDTATEEIQKWCSLASRTILVAENHIPGFHDFLQLSPEEWADQGCPRP